MIEEHSNEDPIEIRRRDAAAALMIGGLATDAQLRQHEATRPKVTEPEKTPLKKDIDLVANYFFESSTDGRTPLTAEVVKAGARLVESFLLGIGAGSNYPALNDQRWAPGNMTGPMSGGLRPPQTGQHPDPDKDLGGASPRPFPMFEHPTEPGART